jgi:hypothetical protein
MMATRSEERTDDVARPAIDLRAENEGPDRGRAAPSIQEMHSPLVMKIGREGENLLAYTDRSGGKEGHERSARAFA